MSKEKIRLRVPADPPEDFPEFISHGNFSVELRVGEAWQQDVEVDNAEFADWLVREYGLEEISREVEEETPAPAEPENPLEADYSEEFPGRKVLIVNNIAVETARNLNRDQLIALDGIGEKTADAIIEFFADGGNE